MYYSIVVFIVYYFYTGTSFEDALYASSCSKASLTLQYVLDTLTTCCLHDSQQTFVSKETFEVLLCPLINQVYYLLFLILLINLSKLHLGLKY